MCVKKFHIKMCVKNIVSRTPPLCLPFVSLHKVVSVKVNHSTLVYIVYYNVKLLALIIYKCINYITQNTSYILFYNIVLQVHMNNPIN